MIKRIQQTVSIALTLIGASAAYAETDYEIYPRPQSFKYDHGSFKISSAVNVVYERGIDKYTKARLETILKKSKIAFKSGRKLVRGKTNILVGINESGELVDKYFNRNIRHKETFFDKNDSHIVSVDNNVIAVLGDDTDSAFFGITSLKHVFNQLEGTSIREFRIDDYSNVKHRGFIEGYYGNPWSNEDRAELMKFGGDYKLNTYFFAPKDDVYHNKKWRELYPAKELAEIKKLAKVGNETKNKYVYALHTFMHSPIRFDNKSNYQNDLNIIKAKFTQLLKNDVRAFSILADDAGVPAQGASTYVTLLEDLTAWLITQKKTYPDLVTDLPFCPNDYGGNGGSEQLKITNQAPRSASIIMTGGRIWGEVSDGFTTNFIKNIESKGHEGRPPYLWINWPCSDNSVEHLIMGGNDTFLHPGVSADNISGIILNPMQQAEANKSALFAIGDYAWNIWDDKEQADQNWHDSFKYMDHGTAEDTKASKALRTICRHMINQDMDSRVRVLQESVELAPKLDDVKELLGSKSPSKEDTAALIEEFQALKDAAAYYRENPGSKRTQGQIIYWLQCWEDTTTAAINYLKCVDAVTDGDNDAIWSYYSTAQTAFAKSKTYKYSYVNTIQKAEVGVQHIVPFIKAMEKHLSPIVVELINSGHTVSKPDSNKVYTNTRLELSAVSTLAQTKLEPAKALVLRPGEYIGVKLDRIKDLSSIEKTVSSAKLTLQVSRNALVWKAVKGGKLPDARYIRLINRTKRPVKFSLTKFEVNSNEIYPISLIKAHAKPYKKNVPERAFDGDYSLSSSFEGGFNEGDSIEYDLGQVITVDNLKYVVLDTETDYIRDAKFQLSLDGKTWKDAFSISRSNDDSSAKPLANGYTHGSLSKGVIPISHAYKEGAKLNKKARYLRILATKSYTPRWIMIAEILINNGQYLRVSNNPTFVSQQVELKNHEPEKMFDGDLSTSYRPDTKKGKIKRGFITYKISEDTQIKQINIVQSGNAISNAKVMVKVGKKKGWQLLGTLDKSLNQLRNTKFKHILEMRIVWKGMAPSINEVIIIPK